jgi:hypothetical protein
MNSKTQSMMAKRRRVSEQALIKKHEALANDIATVEAEKRNADKPKSQLNQRNVLDTIGGEALDTSEIAQAFGVSNSKVLPLLKQLESDGHVAREDADTNNLTDKSVSGGRSSIKDLVWAASNRDESHAERMKRFDSAHKPSTSNPT